MKPTITLFLKKLSGMVLIILAVSGLPAFWEEMAAGKPQAETVILVLQDKTIVLDPGHGGADPGAIAEGLKEADLNMKLALVLKNKLEKYGANVKLTRQGDFGLVPDKRMSFYERWYILRKRKNFAAKQNCRILLSIHTNSNEDPRTSGAIVFYSDGKSRKLAEKIQYNLNLLGIRPRKVSKSNFAIIKGNAMPAVLVEAGFITNKKDREILLNKTDLVAEYICRGILEYEEKASATLGID